MIIVTVFAVVLVVAACVVAVVGLLLLTQATQGVGILALACLLAIFARMAQAAVLAMSPEETALGSMARVTLAPAGVGVPATPAPAIGDRLSLHRAVKLHESANRRSRRLGYIQAGMEFVVVSTAEGWLFVQSDDGKTEGWIETSQQG